MKVSCPEEIAFHKGYINTEQLQRLIHPLRKSNYGRYPSRLVDN